jgi:nicotinate-nucleotide adenylyltransferase
MRSPKIGLFGGTFNPIHYGHLRSAEEIFEAFGLAEVIFIPSADPPHKKKENLLDAPLRVEMVKLAIADNPHFSLSEIELHRSGKSYSIETLAHFRENLGAQADLYFILGLDAFKEIRTWKEYADLFELSHFIIMTRPGLEKNFSLEFLPVELSRKFCYDAEKRAYLHSSGFWIYPREITALDISATKIRENLGAGRSIRYLLPPAVETFIYRNKLYQSKEPKDPA